MNPVTFQEALIAAYIDNPCQVLPTHRGRGLATALVLELLTRVQKRSAFTTVSGRVNNDTSPNNSTGAAASPVRMSGGYSGDK